MGEQRVRILVVGANASQGMYGNQLLDDSLLSNLVETYVTFYDRKVVEPKPHLPHVVKGVQQKRVVFVNTFPSNQYFDVVVIAVSSEQHVPALRETLDKLAELPRLLVLEKPLGVSAADLEWYRSVSNQLQPLTVVNEPYHFMNSMAELLVLAKAKPLAEVNVWASKKRRMANNHGGLKVFAIEFPHLHGAASRFAGQVLGVADCHVNEYYRDVQGTPNNDGNFAWFTVGGVAYTVAQGLGSFVMDRYGSMRANDNPPRTRKIRLTHVDGSYVELDIESAFPTRDSQQVKGGELYFYDANHNVEHIRIVPDAPRRSFAEFILQRAIEPRTPILDDVSLLNALARNQAILELRSAATEITGEHIPSV